MGNRPVETPVIPCTVARGPTGSVPVGAAGILLAAGESQRMGRVKALLPHPDGSGRALVRAAAETLLATGLRPLVAVLGHARREIASELGEVHGPVRVVVNSAYRSGMLSSLKAGVRTLAEEADIGWVVVTPVDQPFLSPGLIRRLLSAATSADAPPVAVVPATSLMERTGTWGLPVVLGRRIFREILEFSGTRSGEPGASDRGAARLLSRHRRNLVVVRADERELADLDDRESYEQAKHDGTAAANP